MTEEDLVQLVEQTIAKKENGKTMDEMTAEQAAASAAQPSYVAPKTLDSVMDLERLKNKDGKEIGDIWRKYHAHRSAVFGK